MSDEAITYKVSVYEKIKVYEGKRRTTYYVRWRLDDQECSEPFQHVGQAKSFQSELLTAAKKGEAFSLTTGRPVAWRRDQPEEPEGPPPVSWHSLTLDYARAKWKFAKPNQRKSIAEALADATEVLLSNAGDVLTIEDSPYTRAEIRRALQGWAFSGRLRGDAPPEDTAPVLKWLETATIAVVDLADTDNGRARAVLERISSKQDGTLAAPNTANRKRQVLNNLMKYAELERKLLTGNPLKSITWTKPRQLKVVDPRCVINSDQAERFLEEVGKLGERGRRLKAFFGCMYYAALRPEEVTDLRAVNITDLPEDGEDEWGEFLLTNSQPRSGSNWTDDGSVRQRQALKHRADDESRPVPIHPDLVKLLRAHIVEFGTGPGGR